MQHGTLTVIGIVLAWTFFSAVLPAQADPADRITVSAGGRAMFELFFYGKDKGPDEWDLSKRNPSSAEMLSIAQGWGIFADVLAPKAANRAALGVDVLMINEMANAHCESALAENGLPLLGDAIINGTPMKERAYMDLGTGMQSGLPSPLPLHSLYGEIYSTAAHEAGHGLGLLSALGESTSPEGPPTLSLLDKDLVSYATGKAVRLSGVEVLSQVQRVSGDNYYNVKTYTDTSGQAFVLWGGDPVDDPAAGAFLIGDCADSKVYFAGDETLKTLNAFGADLHGVPVEGFEQVGTYIDGTPLFTPDLSHLELARSMMSHQNYRNWNFFMEAELAVLKDLGYEIDLKRFYGTSIYGSNLGRIVNKNPYYAPATPTAATG